MRASVDALIAGGSTSPWSQPAEFPAVDNAKGIEIEPGTIGASGLADSALVLVVRDSNLVDIEQMSFVVRSSFVWGLQ